MSRPEIPQSFIPQALSDLQIHSGTQIQLELVSKSQRYKSEWIGSSAKDLIYIRAPKGAGRLVPGTRVRVRVLQDNWVCAFTTEIQHHQAQPEALWLLAYPSSIEVARLREETRLPVAIRVRVDGSDPLEGPEGVNGLISDLHMRGAALLTHVPVGEEGDHIFLTTRLSFAQTEHLVMLAAHIVNHRSADPGAIYTEQYGLRLDPMDDETRVYLQGYLAQMQLSYLGYEL